MAVPFHHGTRVFQSGEDAVLVTLGDTSVVGILGTADDAVVADWPLNTPVLITNPTQATSLGDAGTLKDNLDTIFDAVQTSVVVVRIDAGADAAELLANAVGDFATMTGIQAFLKAASAGLPKPKLILAPGLSTTSPADGVASVAVTAPGTNYGDATSLSIAGATGSGAEISPIIGAGGTLDGVQVDKPGYGYTGPLVVTVDDADGGSGATFTGTIGAVMNPITAEAMGICEKLRAMFYADGPDGSDLQAVTARNLIGSQRVFYSDPRVIKSIGGSSVPMPSSAVFAGQQAALDRARGVHWPGSNKPVNGIIGTNRPIIYGTQADYLNENQVNTIINRGDGFRTWGVWTCAQESVWQFVNVVRTTDAVNEAIERAYLEFVDRPMTRANLDFMVWSGVQALNNFENDGMLLPGSVFKLADGNTPTTGAAGIVKFLMAFEVPAPMVDIRIDSHRNIEVGYTLLFNSVTGEVNVA
jgi:Bacteriophage tail sheath protein